jgi:hypothetical protein
MMFQLRHCYARRNRVEKVLWSSSKVPFIIDRFQLAMFLAHARRVQGMMFQLRHYYGNSRRSTLVFK